MFTIDFLKGTGEPIKSKPGGTFLIAVAFFAPALFAALIVGNYLHSRIIMLSKERELSNLKTRIARIQSGRGMLKQTRDFKDQLGVPISEAADVVSWNIQWTQVLKAVSEVTPEVMTIEQLETKKYSKSVEMPLRKDPEKTVTISIPQPALMITVVAKQSDITKDDVDRFMENLQYHPAIMERVEDVYVVTSDSDEETQSVRYIVECVFTVSV